MEAREFRDDALALDEVEDVPTWGHPTYRIHGRIFAGLPEDGVGMVKATLDEQQALTASDDAYAPAPRLGRHGWVHIALRDARREQVRQLLHEAWRRTAPARPSGTGRAVGSDHGQER